MLKWHKNRAKKKKTSVINCSTETLVGCAFLFFILTGAISAVFIYQGSDKKTSQPKENFLKRAATPALTDVYRLETVQREGKDLTFLLNLRKKKAPDANGNHPAKIPKIIAGPE